MSKDNELVVVPTQNRRDKDGQHLTDHAFAMRWTKRRSWQRLAVVDRDELPALRPSAAGLNFGQTVIDAMRAYRMGDGVVAVFRPDSHIKRLNNGARRLALPQVDFDRAWGAIRRLVELDSEWIPEEPGQSLYLRLVLAGNGSTLAAGPAEEALCYVLAAPGGPPQANTARAMVVDGYTRGWPGGTGNINAAGNFGASVVPDEIARNYGYDQVLWLDGVDGRFVKQVGGGNVFFVVDGVLTTPSLDATVLPGITRDTIVKLARDAGTRVVERHIELAEVVKGIDDGSVTECFSTSTETGVTAISAIGAAGQEHRLPQPTQDSATAHYRTLVDGLHRGDVDDRFGWMRRLTEVATVHS